MGENELDLCYHQLKELLAWPQFTNHKSIGEKKHIVGGLFMPKRPNILFISVIIKIIGHQEFTQTSCEDNAAKEAKGHTLV